MADTTCSKPIMRLGLPKGRMQQAVIDLLNEAGIDVRIGARAYRPSISLENYDVKLLKPQNILEMLDSGSRDIGFAGHDWVKNLDVEVVELLDLGLDPVQIVAASPDIAVLNNKSTIRIASEYERLTKEWIREKGLDARFVRTYGATESFPPEDADLIVDNSATGSTLKANGLVVIDVVLKSSTRLYASRAAYDNPKKRAEIDNLVMLVQSVLDARKRVLISFNVSENNLDRIVQLAPCMTAPTISQLYHMKGFAVSVAAPKSESSEFLLQLKKLGATDILISKATQIVL